MDLALQERLDRNYRYQRRVYDLTRRYYLLGRNRLIADLAPPDRGCVLEIGCGTARNLVACAHRYPTVDLYGVDLSRAMLETAGRKLERHGMRGRIMLGHGDAENFDAQRLFGVTKFDRIIISYALSMIPSWRGALRHAVGQLVPGGELHVVDFGTGHGLPVPANSALRAWLAHFHVTPRDELGPVMREISSERGAGLDIEPLYRGYAVRAVLTAP